MPASFRKLAPGLYTVAIALTAAYLIEVGFAAWPPRLGDPSWRFGFAGIALTSFLPLLLSLLVAGAVSALLEHRGALRVVAVLALVLAVVVLVGLVGFGLDIMQLRAVAREQVRPTFDRAASKALALGVAYLPALLLLGIGGWRGSRRLGSGRDRTEAGGLVVGQHSSTAA